LGGRKGQETGAADWEVPIKRALIVDPKKIAGGRVEGDAVTKI